MGIGEVRRRGYGHRRGQEEGLWEGSTYMMRVGYSHPRLHIHAHIHMHIYVLIHTCTRTLLHPTSGIV